MNVHTKATLAVIALASALTLPALAQEAAAAAPSKGPRIAVEPPTFNFGDSLKGKELAKEFSIRNFGNDDLLIQGVTTTCGCTVADGYARVVKPGGSTPLRVKLHTAVMGRVVKSVLIKTNDPVKSTYELKIEANFVPDGK